MSDARRLGVDVGGTFTDLVLVDGDAVLVAKVPSTPTDQSQGIAAGIDRLGADVASLARFAHGTTVATNAVLERTGARVVLVTTEGFRDVLEIARQDRPHLYDQWADRTPPVVPRELVVEAPERVLHDGQVLRPLDDPEAVAVRVRELDPEAVAISLLHAYRRPDHERAIAAALDGVPVSLSSEILPVFREYERTSTTAMNAYVRPVMERYLASLERLLVHGHGMTCPVEVMRSGGGTFRAARAAATPVHTLLSGPAAGAWGAAAVGRAIGEGQLLGFDMGGTSTDVTVIANGRPETATDGEIDGLPFAVTTTDIHTIGSGGGSIAWIDAGGALRVGPRSAGAEPGPACYGKGGTLPTVTDANVVLGRLPADSRLGGDLPLHPELAHAAIAGLADDLGLTVEETALGVLRVVEAQMVKALRVVSVERGRDPRSHALMPFGGAGPLHQAALARALGVPRVIVPRSPGVLCALGLLAAAPTTEAVTTVLTPLAELDAATIEGVTSRLAESARRELALGCTVEAVAALRYAGQGFELEVDLPPGVDPNALGSEFHAAHRRRYGYDQPDAGVELVNVRVTARAEVAELALPEASSGTGAEAARVDSVEVYVGAARREVPRYDRAGLGHGDRFTGPAIVAGVDATVFVEDGQHVEVDRYGNLLIEEA